MKNFLPPKPILEKVSKGRIDRFIERFNKELAGNAKECYTLNTGLDKGVERLNDSEFVEAQIQAKNNGWLLNRNDDNYQAITYLLKPIK